jgi:SAM-dependent methyltransferase
VIAGCLHRVLDRGVTPSDAEDEARRIATTASEEDPTGWFEQLYTSAQSGRAAIPWEREGANPLLAAWTSAHALDGHGRVAVVVGCGLGKDAEHLAALGFDTTAFDIAPTGVASARERHPGSRVHYTVADLLALPDAWRGGFDLVFESLTVQSLPIALHSRAIGAVCSLVTPGGTLLVVAAARDDGTEVEGPPWPLTRREIDEFACGDLRIRQIEELTDEHDPDVRRWRVELRRRT